MCSRWLACLARLERPAIALIKSFTLVSSINYLKRGVVVSMLLMLFCFYYFWRLDLRIWSSANSVNAPREIDHYGLAGLNRERDVYLFIGLHTQVMEFLVAYGLAVHKIDIFHSSSRIKKKNPWRIHVRWDYVWSSYLLVLFIDKTTVLGFMDILKYYYTRKQISKNKKSLFGK